MSERRTCRMKWNTGIVNDMFLLRSVHDSTQAMAGRTDEENCLIAEQMI